MTNIRLDTVWGMTKRVLFYNNRKVGMNTFQNENKTAKENTTTKVGKKVATSEEGRRASIITSNQ